MKISIIIRRLDIKGGVQRHVLAIAKHFLDAGHKVAIYTFKFEPQNTFEEFSSLKVVSLDYFPKSKGFISDFLRQRRASIRLAKLIDKDSDIVNAHDHVSFKVSYYFKKKNKNVAAVWTMHDMPTKFFSYLREAECGSIQFSYVRGMILKIVDFLTIRPYIISHHSVVVLDERDRAYVKKYFGMESTIVRNGIDVKQFSFVKHSAPQKNSRLRLLMNGIFFNHRRFEDGIEALYVINQMGIDAEMTIVGDYSKAPEYFSYLKSLGEKLVPRRLVFTGKVSDQDLIKSYSDHDIFLFPNHLQSWGLAVFEAMSAGLPVIVSETAGASEVLDNYENAMLVPPKNPEAIAGAIIKLMNSDLYIKMSENGRNFVEQNSSWEKCAHEMLAIFSNVYNSLKKADL